MVFLILSILAFLLLFVFRTYRTVFAVIVAVLLILGITSAVLAWGITVFSQGGRLAFFHSEIGAREFYHLMAAWYGADILCSVLVVRNFRAYKSVNAGSGGAGRPGAEG